MKKFFAILVIGLAGACASQAQTQQAPDWQWAKAIPSLSFEDGVIPRAITVNGQELVTVGGTFAAAMVLGPDTIINYPPMPLPFNMFYSFQAAYNNQGQYQYGMHSASTGGIRDLAHDGLGNTYSLALTSDSTGSRYLNLLKYNPISGVLGSQQLPYNSLTLGGLALAVTPGGEAYITVTLPDTVTWGGNTLVSAGFQDVFLAKFSAQLQLEWVKQAGGTKSDIGTALGIAPDGGCYLAGAFQDTAQFGGQQLISSGNSDMFLANYNPQGNVVWINTANSDGWDQVKPLSLAVSENGQILVAGYIYGSANVGTDTLISQGMEDVFVSAWSAQGHPLWAKSGGTAMYDYPTQIATDSANNAYLLFNAASTGFVYDGAAITGAQEQADYLLKLNPMGELIWVKRIGDGTSTGTVQSRGLSVTPGGTSYVTGNYYGSAVFGTTQLQQSPVQAINGFVASLNATVVGLEPEIAKQKLVVYPNPASGSVTILLPEVSQQPVQVQLHNLTGQLVFEQSFSGSQAQVVVALPALPGGLYVVSVAGQHFSQTGMLIVE